MFTPPLLLSLLVASAYGVAFTVWQGRGLRDLFAFWLAAVLGFAAGHLAGEHWNLVPVTIGPVHILEATVGSVLFLVISRWLRLSKQKP